MKLTFSEPEWREPWAAFRSCEQLLASSLLGRRGFCQDESRTIFQGQIVGGRSVRAFQFR